MEIIKLSDIFYECAPALSTYIVLEGWLTTFRNCGSAAPEYSTVQGNKKTLEKKHIQLSRRKIARIMKALGLESAYSNKKFKVVSGKVNDACMMHLFPIC